MQYTLDSVTHFVATLQAKHKNRKITYEPIILSGQELVKIAENTDNQNTYFFGVFSLMADFSVICFMKHNDDPNPVPFMIAEGPSQFIEGFSYVMFNAAGRFWQADLLDFPFVASFRGFEITLS